tara:strand:- start:573 stop:857 length:285 start_codon:yes stop_codon:yes gene_type:complete
MGEDAMKSPQARRNRRNKIIEISMSLLGASEEGLRVSYIQKIIEDSCRFRCSPNTLGQVMNVKVRSGEVEQSLTKEGHSFWKLNPVYIPPVETE